MDKNKITGTIHNWQYGNKMIFTEGNGPKHDAFLAQTENDNWA